MGGDDLWAQGPARESGERCCDLRLSMHAFETRRTQVLIGKHLRTQRSRQGMGQARFACRAAHLRLVTSDDVPRGKQTESDRAIVEGRPIITAMENSITC